MKEAGNLEGILLTGLTKDGVDLMESYVDRTGDVQTASFCMLKVHERKQIIQTRSFCLTSQYVITQSKAGKGLFWHSTVSVFNLRQMPLLIVLHQANGGSVFYEWIIKNVNQFN